MFSHLRIWVWILWAAALVVTCLAVRAEARAEGAPGGTKPITTTTSGRNVKGSPTTTNGVTALSTAFSKSKAVLALQSRIRALQPHARGAAALAQALQKVAPAQAAVLIALAMQESSLVPQHRWYPDGSADLGVFQINSKTAVHYGCHLERLLTFDEEESVRCAARVLRDKRATCLGWGLSDEEATACYHSYTKTHRLKYLKALRRHQ